MEVKFVEKPTPHLLLEDVFTDKDLEFIWNEINFLQPKFLEPEQTEGAKVNEKIIKKNSGLFLYPLYANFSYSDIIRITNERIYYEDYLKSKWSIPWIRKSFETCNWDTILLSHYGDNDYYDSHTDRSVFTTVIWIWKEPKSFEGGKFFLDNYSYEVEVKNNSGIIFLSTELHSVSPVKILEKNSKNCGRYSITSFCGLGMPNQ